MRAARSQANAEEQLKQKEKTFKEKTLTMGGGGGRFQINEKNIYIILEMPPTEKITETIKPKYVQWGTIPLLPSPLKKNIKKIKKTVFLEIFSSQIQIIYWICLYFKNEK